MMKTHMNEECPCVVVPCTNHGCQEQIARGVLRRHVKHECLFRSVKCSFAKYGCNIGRIAYSDLLKHNKEFEVQHLHLQVAYHGSKIDVLEQVGVFILYYMHVHKKIRNDKKTMNEMNSMIHHLNRELVESRAKVDRIEALVMRNINFR
ncbi:hypothetical protein RFI_31738 [Reticulomyxa filosa]|uniref:TRAF-type domain-containing protein n=1 Tax=Reticulomyxa filosa TaxID=46433 RepID=X6LY53_RETFI|nr:hypothetical protein RFI_31738 [Reticulomyxa filosa]|eukprot:ETO05660.1 hypothetical protein RFI_31738 [Reticulomyxa filosa]